MDGKWVIDYGSYAHGFHATRGEAMEVATQAAQNVGRALVVDAEP